VHTSSTTAAMHISRDITIATSSIHEFDLLEGAHAPPLWCNA